MIGRLFRFGLRAEVSKLRKADTFRPDALARLKAKILEHGAEAVAPLAELLGHGVARPHAVELLTRLLDDESLPVALGFLASQHPAQVSGVAEALIAGRTFRPERLLDAAFNDEIPKAVAERVLSAHIARIPAHVLVRNLTRDGREAQAVLLRLLERVADPSVATDLGALLNHADWAVRLTGVRILGNLGLESSIRPLSARLTDGNREVRLQALQSLHQMKAGSAHAEVAKALRDADLKVQTAAIDFLVEHGSAATVPHLLHVLRDESEYARRAAVEVLNAVATPEAIGDLIRVLRDEDWWVRVRAADALGTLGGERVVDAVIGLLDGEEEFLRRFAVEILVMVPDERSVPPLLHALEDEDWWVRERAIDALGETGSPLAVDPLLALMGVDAALAPLCARALGRLRDPRAESALKELSEHGAPEAAREAKAALAALAPDPVADATRRPGSRTDRVVTRLPEAPTEDRSSVHGHREIAKAPAHPAPTNPGRSADPIPGASESASEERSPAISPPESPGRSSPPAAINFFMLEPGTIILDRFHIIRRAGKGGFGAVYLVEDRAVGEEIILKVLSPQLSADEVAVRRFVQELRLTRRITHKNVIRIYDLIDLGGLHAVSMEYFPGKNLDERMNAGEGFPPERCLRIMRQICEGLMAAHAEGVVHRDMKPANVLVDDGGLVKVVDFGLAWAGTRMESRLTKSGLLVGTPEYMAPEQIRGESIDARTDIYAMGILLYQLLSGELPYDAETPVQILFKHLEGGAPTLDTLVHGLDPRLVSLTSRAMAMEPNERPIDVLAFAEEIDEILGAGAARATGTDA